MRCSWIRELLVVAIFATIAFSPRLHAQEYRATITGVVTDASKAVIPGATVSVKNLDTNEVLVVKTDKAGVYAVPYLHPGSRLEVSATANGFNTETYPPVVLSVSQVRTANFVLKIGAASQEVTVTSQSYQVGLDTEKADRGSIIDNKTMTQMPLNGRDVLSLMDYLPGVTNENGAGAENGIATMGSADAFTVNGTEAGNMDFTIDGMPNNALPWYLEKTPSVIPSVDALQEVKVTTSPYDAEQGHTAAGGVSMELKSGTNQLHGGVWEFARRGYLDSNPWINNYYDEPRPGHTEDQYGFEIDGPVLLPKIYNGKNRTFFMFNFEKFKQILPNFQEFDVPDAQWLQGDFSNFVDPSGLLYPVYDPATANAGNAYARTIFQNSAGQPNMVDVSRFNPIALKVLTSVQQAAPPTTIPIPGKSPWEDIWLNTQSSHNTSTNYIAKIDQTLGSKDHITASWVRVFDPFSTPWTPPGVPWFNGSNYTEYHANYGLDWVHTISSTLLTDVHFSYQRYWNSDGPNAADLNFDPTTLGIPASQLGPLKLGFPEFNISMQQQTYAQGGGYGGFIGISRDFYKFPSDTDSIAPKITWIKKQHNIRAGIDLRDSHATNPLQYYNSISFSSNGQATSELWNQNNSNSNPTAPNGTPLSQLGSGNAVLDMLIGQPNSVNVTNEIFPYYTWHYYAPWVQDDWKITPTLTLNLGFRYDFNAPVTARHGYTQAGFDLNAVNPINNLVSVPGVATLKGGLIYPNTTGSDRAWGWDLTQWQPRIGFAWQARSGTVLRGGAGRTIINSADTPQATGFNYPPVYNNSPDGGRTYFANNMTTPFPGGIPTIPGASQGLLTNVGQGILFDNPHLRMASVVNGSLGLEQAVAHSGKFEISYVMSRGYDLTAQSGNHFTNGIIDENPALYKSCNDALGLTNPNNPYPSLACNTQVSNPFYDVTGVTGSLYDNPTTSAYQLARPYPEFEGISADLQNWGHSWYNSLQTTYQQRIGWVQVNASETWSKTMQSGGYISQIYNVKIRSISPTDRQNRATMTGIFYLPIGRGMKYFGHMNRILDGFIGGWELATDAFWESGQPVSLPSGAFNIVGDIHSHSQKPHNTADIIYTNVNPCTEVWNSPYQSVNANGQTVNNPGSYTLEEYGQQVTSCSGGNAVAWQGVAGYGPSTTQLYTDQFRGSDLWQEDVNLSKNLKITSRVNMQLRLETFNVFNHPTWNSQVDMDPTDQTFGMVDKPLTYGQSNIQRQAQLGAKVTW